MLSWDRPQPLREKVVKKFCQSANHVNVIKAQNLCMKMYWFVAVPNP